MTSVHGRDRPVPVALAAGMVALCGMEIRADSCEILIRRPEVSSPCHRLSFPAIDGLLYFRGGPDSTKVARSVASMLLASRWQSVRPTMLTRTCSKARPMIQKPTASISEISPRRALRYVFVLLPQFSLVSFSAALEPLVQANNLSAVPLFDTATVSLDGQPVCSSCGVPVQADLSLAELGSVDTLFICAASPLDENAAELLVRWLQQRPRAGQALAGIGAGSELLARAGLLDGYQVACHWRELKQLRERFPRLTVSTRLFELDRDRYTCSGGAAAMDMALTLVARQEAELAAQLCELLVCERIRSAEEPQRVPLRSRLGAGSHPKLVEAVELMEANLEEPLSSDDLAHHVGVSRRHLERLFKKQLDQVPSQYYLELRLEQARQLLRTTELPVLDVASRCGFASASYFSTAYRNHYQLTPREERRTHNPLASTRRLQPQFGHSTVQS